MKQINKMCFAWYDEIKTATAMGWDLFEPDHSDSPRLIITL